MITHQKRRDIRSWAISKAFEEAMQKGIEIPFDYQVPAISYGCQITESVWKWEKAAYLKIHLRSQRHAR